MKDTFSLPLGEIQPSQLFISETKLNAVLEVFNNGRQSQLEPFPLKELDGELVSTDGHTRGVSWLKNDYEVIEVYWEDCNLDWEAYRICVQWCKEGGITEMGDICDRIVPHEDYQVLWLERCQLCKKT